MRRGHIRAIAGACLAAVALSACGDSGDAATDIETTAPTLSEAESPTPTPTSEPVEETSEPVEVPEPDLAIESEADVEKVVREILAFRDWLFANPDQAFRLETIYLRTCDCYDTTLASLEELAEDGERIVAESPPEVLSSRVSDSVETAYGVQVEWRVAPVELQTTEGEVLYSAEGPGEVQREGWSLVRQDGVYRLGSVVRRNS